MAPPPPRADAALDFRAVFEAGAGVQLVLAPLPPHRILAVSDGAVQALARDRDQLVGRGLFEVLPGGPDDPAAASVGALAASLARARHSGADHLAAHRHDLPGPPATGGCVEHWWHTTARVVRSDGGELRALLLQLEDITASIHGDDWTSIIAHDLQGPVNAIVLTSEVLVRRRRGTRDHDEVERIRTSAARLSRMIRELADAAALARGQLRIRREPVELGALIRDVVARRPDAPARTDVRIAPAPIALAGDAARLEQALSTLLAHALEHGAPDAPVRVEVDHADGVARITLTSPGASVAGDALQAMFAARGHAPTGACGRGHGASVGLYVARALLEAHGGHLSAEGAPGAAMTFRITLPAPCADAAP